jgi:Cu/Ag efflux protein CusF
MGKGRETCDEGRLQIEGGQQNMTKITSFAVGGALALTLAACSMTEKPKPMAPEQVAPPTPLAGKLSETVVTASATVEKVDLKTRHVTLRGADGKSITVKAPEEVRNLPQVKVGDEVVIAYYDSVAYEVKPAGSATPGVTVAQDAARAQPGEKPGAYGASAVTLTATIDAIDKAASTVTLKGPEGNTQVFKIRDTAKLDQVKVGDLVQLTYTEAVAVSVEPKPKP